MNIANQGFPATRADLNNALQALASNNSGTSAPSTTFANQWWYDTANNKLYIRNEANNAWIQVAVLDQTNAEWQVITGVIQAKDGDGLVFQTDDGTTRIAIADSDGDVAFDTDTLYVDAGNDRIGINEATPKHPLDARTSTTGAIPTDASVGVSSTNDNYVGIMNESDTSTYSGLAFETRTSGAARWLIANEWQATYKGDLVFRTRDGGTSSSESIRLLNEGGITFNGDTAADNALNDYERGLHTITINQGGIGINTLYQNFQYIKIGDFVNIHGLLLVSSGGDSNDLRVNMPFTARSGLAQTADATHGLVSSYKVPTGSGGIRCTISKGTNKLRFLKTVDNNVWTSLLGNELANGDHLYVNITYEVA